MARLGGGPSEWTYIVDGDDTVPLLRQPDVPASAVARLPGAVRSSLPAISDLVGIAAVPHLHYVRSGREGIADTIEALSFRPERSLTGPGFTVV